MNILAEFGCSHMSNVALGQEAHLITVGASSVPYFLLYHMCGIVKSANGVLVYIMSYITLIA